MIQKQQLDDGCINRETMNISKRAFGICPLLVAEAKHEKLSALPSLAQSWSQMTQKPPGLPNPSVRWRSTRVVCNGCKVDLDYYNFAKSDGTGVSAAICSQEI